MIVYVLQRLLGLVPVLFGISVVIFLTMKLIPGDVARALLGPMATDQTLAQLRHALGLDEAIYVQYGKWLWRALNGDLGLSPIVHKPVMEQTQQDEPGDIGFAALRPGDDVVCLRPVRRPIASWEAAAAITDSQRANRRARASRWRSCDALGRSASATSSQARS